MCMMHLMVGAFFPWPAVAFFPPLLPVFLVFIAFSSKLATVASSGFMSLLLLLLVLVTRQLRLAGCWSTFDACNLRELAVDLADAFNLGLGGIAVLVWVLWLRWWWAEAS